MLHELFIIHYTHRRQLVIPKASFGKDKSANNDLLLSQLNQREQDLVLMQYHEPFIYFRSVHVLSLFRCSFGPTGRFG